MSNSNSDFILVEDPSGNSVQTSTPDVVEELCTTDCHVENCSCFQKQEAKIKQLQEELKKEMYEMITGGDLQPVASKGKASTSEDVEITGVTINHSKDVDYWMQQSANELRAQLVLRGWKRADAGVKGLKQLQKL